MLDFTSNDLTYRARLAQLEREADARRRTASLHPQVRGFRARMAARLAHLALHLDGETTRTMVRRHLHPAR